jgi:hypothetical protein
VRSCADNCENPSDSDAEEDIDGLRDCVREHGWVIKYVEDHRRPYAYTMGLHQFGMPELVVTGVTTERAFALLDYFIEETIGDCAMIEAVDVDHPDAHLDLAVRLFGPKLRAVQLVWTDMCRLWPWDARYDFGGLRQPVLGVRAQNA